MTSRPTGMLCLLAIVLTGLFGCSSIQELRSPQAPAWTHADRVRMGELADAVNQMRAMLLDYYAGPLVLEHSWMLPLDHPLRNQGIHFLAAKFARSIVWEEPLVIGTIGSSVLAGHDNCRYDCYQQQLTRLLGPVLATAGSRLEVRNTGQGGNCGDSFDNQIWCLPMLAGKDIDIAHYSWTYFESGMPEKATMAHEMFYRWSLLMDHAPVPQLIYAGGCKGLPRRDLELLDNYAAFGTDILCMTRGLEELGYKRREWGEMGHPLHETSREGAAPGTSELRKNSLSVMYRNWHPGPLLFQTTADVLAWRYSEALLKALEWIRDESDPKARWPRKPVKLELADLPENKVCPEEWCNATGLPVCVNFEQPVFGQPGVELLDTTDQGWVFEEGEPLIQYVIPKEEKDLPQCLHPNRCSGWRVPPNQQVGALSFSLPDLRVGMVAVCCASKGCGKKMLEAGVTFLLDNQVPESPPEQMWADKCVQVQARFPVSARGQESSVERTLRLDVTQPALGKPPPAITHVFGL